MFATYGAKDREAFRRHRRKMTEVLGENIPCTDMYCINCPNGKKSVSIDGNCITLAELPDTKDVENSGVKLKSDNQKFYKPVLKCNSAVDVMADKDGFLTGVKCGYTGHL